jgi:hypothetical protein
LSLEARIEREEMTKKEGRKENGKSESHRERNKEKQKENEINECSKEVKEI